MKKLIAIILSLFNFTTSASEYAVGQIWEYNTRINEENSKLYIVKIDSNTKLGNIYHIYVDQLNIKNPRVDGGIQTDFPHIPVNEETLNSSVTNKIGISKTLPDISEGYNTWKEAFDSGKGGVFNIELKDIIKNVEGIINDNA